MAVKPFDCTCDDGFTCGYCLRNTKPWHFTTSKSFSEWLEDQRVLEAEPWRLGR